ncbi:hypothetical protein K8R43_00385 [archaeon]|nr:hypothetical protein [archaeon]
MGRQLKKPWEEFKTEAYTIPGVSEVRHRNEPGWEKEKNKNLTPILIIGVLVAIALIIIFGYLAIG